MAVVRSSLSVFSNFLSTASNYTTSGFQQIRHKYANRWMRRDDLRRQLAKKHAEERLCYVALKRNDILPVEIKKNAAKSMSKAIPRQTAMRQLNPRCIITSRGRGVVYRFRLSRIMFRQFADASELSGIQRAIW